ncbi:MAG: hypothetical protein PHG55_05130, partial [Verrucomicrobiota bacterium]|nr:hypothetical protein [Verrucomicrobiota bacterium]
MPFDCPAPLSSFVTHTPRTLASSLPQMPKIEIEFEIGIPALVGTRPSWTAQPSPPSSVSTQTIRLL